MSRRRHDENKYEAKQPNYQVEFDNLKQAMQAKIFSNHAFLKKEYLQIAQTKFDKISRNADLTSKKKCIAGIEIVKNCLAITSQFKFNPTTFFQNPSRVRAALIHICKNTLGLLQSDSAKYKDDIHNKTARQILNLRYQQYDRDTAPVGHIYDRYDEKPNPNMEIRDRDLRDKAYKITTTAANTLKKSNSDYPKKHFIDLLQGSIDNLKSQPETEIEFPISRQIQL